MGYFNAYCAILLTDIIKTVKCIVSVESPHAILTYGGSVDVREEVMAVRRGGVLKGGVVGQGVAVCVLQRHHLFH